MSLMNNTEIKYLIESALLAAGRPLNITQLQSLFDEESPPEKAQIRQAIGALLNEYEDRGITIKEVASGYRIQVTTVMAERLQKLWAGRAPRYSRALLETLALIAYRQPVTRGDIEDIRGVSVSSNTIRSLVEREWIIVVGHRDVPGHPAMFGTTKMFLDYFGLKKLDDLPPLADLSDWETLRIQLNLPTVEEEEVAEMVEIADLSVPPPQADNEVEEDFDVDIEEVSKFIDDTNFQEIVAIDYLDDSTADKSGEPEQISSGDVRVIDASRSTT
jgi:segregation and condensation protein B